MSTATVDRYHDLTLTPGARKALLARMEQTVLLPLPFSNAADYAKNVPDIRLVSFPGLGHLPHNEVP